ncbi:MAG: hypothetical protein EBU34_12045, partial [Alphaproteobacteria bacterium]|nr:hypothetical protein [Alphaproteobacteria bacterium]
MKNLPIPLLLALSALAFLSGHLQAQSPAAASESENAYSLFSSGNYAGAAAAYEEVIKGYPTDILVQASMIQLAVCQLYTGQYDKALGNLEKAKSGPPLTADQLMMLASLRPQILAAKASTLPQADRKAAFEEAIKGYADYMEKFPQSAEVESARYGRAICFYQIGEYSKSAEELLKFIIDALESGQLSRNIFQLHWNRGLSFDGEKPNLPLENKLRALFPEINPQPIQVADTLQSMDGIDTDVLDEELEELFFPNKSKNNQRKRQSLIKELGINALSNHMVMEAAESLFRPMGSESGNVSRWYESLQTAYQVNWEAALQRWMESVNRMGHSYARPSRRGQFSDFVLPGHLREGRTLNIIMDTSGSMSSTLSNVLGAISYSCHQHQVDQA